MPARTGPFQLRVANSKALTKNRKAPALASEKSDPCQFQFSVLFGLGPGEKDKFRGCFSKTCPSQLSATNSFDAFWWDVRTLTFCQLMSHELFIKQLKVKLLTGEQKATDNCKFSLRLVCGRLKSVSCRFCFPKTDPSYPFQFAGSLTMAARLKTTPYYTCFSSVSTLKWLN